MMRRKNAIFAEINALIMTKNTQESQVLSAMRQIGGYATLRKLYEIVDFSSWMTKTPEASIRRIVQNSPKIFKIQPGLWALEDCRDDVLKKLTLKSGDKNSEETFSHSYFQGLLVEIGKFQKQLTFIPSQDKNKFFLDLRLSDIADTTQIPEFTYDRILRHAKTVDVVWFNERTMPSNFFEIEHTTDFKNSLSKFYELQDFYSGFYIVADESRKKEFDDKLSASIFSPIKKRIKFLSYNKIASIHEALSKVRLAGWDTHL